MIGCSSMNHSDIINIQAKIDKFCEERNWKQFHDPKNLAISLQLEASEVLELFQWTKNNQINELRSKDISDELADVLYWTIMLANHYNIDLLNSLHEKMKKNEKKYPVDKSYGKSDKYNEL